MTNSRWSLARPAKLITDFSIKHVGRKIRDKKEFLSIFRLCIPKIKQLKIADYNRRFDMKYLPKMTSISIEF